MYYICYMIKRQIENSIKTTLSNKKAVVLLAPKDGYSPLPAEPGIEPQQFMGGVTLELLGEIRRVADLSPKPRRFFSKINLYVKFSSLIFVM